MYKLTEEQITEAFYRKNNHRFNLKNNHCPLALLILDTFPHLTVNDVSVGRTYHGIPIIRIGDELFDTSRESDDIVDRFDYNKIIYPQEFENITTDEERFVKVVGGLNK